MKEKPFLPFICSLTGGTVILAVGIYLAYATAFMGSLAFPLVAFITGIPFLATVRVLPGLFGIIYGTVIIVCSAVMYTQPQRIRDCSVVIIVFSVLSWFGTMGGVVAGFILALIGGVTGVVWSPSKGAVSAPKKPFGKTVRFCPQCGEEVQPNSKFCPYCGAKLAD